MFTESTSLRTSGAMGVPGLRVNYTSATCGRLFSGGLPCGVTFWKAVKFVTNPPAELQWLKRSSQPAPRPWVEALLILDPCRALQ